MGAGPVDTSSTTGSAEQLASATPVPPTQWNSCPLGCRCRRTCCRRTRARRCRAILWSRGLCLCLVVVHPNHRPRRQEHLIQNLVFWMCKTRFWMIPKNWLISGVSSRHVQKNSRSRGACWRRWSVWCRTPVCCARFAENPSSQEASRSRRLLLLGRSSCPQTRAVWIHPERAKARRGQ